MGQHKNSAQLQIFINFVEQNPDLARGFAKGDRVHHEQLWLELANELNASGPPKKEVSAWRKVWTDWKLGVKQRLAHNKVEALKTGGGRFNNYILSPIEELVAIVSGLYASVDGVKNAKSFGSAVKNKAHKSTENLATTSTATCIFVSTQPSVSQTTPTSMSPLPPSVEVMAFESVASYVPSVHLSTRTETPAQLSPTNERPSSTPSTPARTPQIQTRKRTRHIVDVGDVIDMETEHFSKISAKLDVVGKEIKENRGYLKELSRNTKDINKNLRDLKILKEKEVNEATRHNYVVEKSLQTRNEIKLQFLELEQMKLGLQQPSSN